MREFLNGTLKVRRWVFTHQTLLSESRHRLIRPRQADFLLPKALIPLWNSKFLLQMRMILLCIRMILSRTQLIEEQNRLEK